MRIGLLDFTQVPTQFAQRNQYSLFGWKDSTTAPICLTNIRNINKPERVNMVKLTELSPDLKNRDCAKIINRKRAVVNVFFKS